MTLAADEVQMISYPSIAGANVETLYYTVHLNQLYAEQGRASTNAVAHKVRELFDYDAELNSQFNHMLDNKWNGMMDQPHIGYTYWNDPEENTMPNLTFIRTSNALYSGLEYGVALQTGDYSINGTTLLARTMDPYMPPEDYRWVEVYMTQNSSVSFTAKSNVSYVSVSREQGSLSSPGPVTKSDSRLDISVDWDQVPEGRHLATISISSGGAPTDYEIHVPIETLALLNDLTSGTFFESNGAVSIEAQHFAEATNSTTLAYAIIPAYGRTLSSVTLDPTDCPPQDVANGGYLSYDFYTFHDSSDTNVTVYIGPSMNIDRDNPLRWAMAVDQMEPQVVTPLWDYVLSPPLPVSQNAIAGIWTNSTVVAGVLIAGKHSLKLWSLDPALVLEKVVIDLGGAQPSFLGAPESLRT